MVQHEAVVIYGYIRDRDEIALREIIPRKTVSGEIIHTAVRRCKKQGSASSGEVE